MTRIKIAANQITNNLSWCGSQASFQDVFFLWLGFEPQTLHILRIVHANLTKLTRTKLYSYQDV